MTKVFFVLHGESEGNTGPNWPTDDTPLTLRGQLQSREVAKRLSGAAPDVILSSPMRRAVQTAEIIASTVRLRSEHHELFTERRLPSSVTGHPIADEFVAAACRTIDENFHVPGFHMLDEEVFNEIASRANQALAYLAARPEPTIIVVTHGFILRVILSQVLFEGKVSGRDCVSVVRRFCADLAAISFVEYDTRSRYSTWRIRFWNDISHLTNLR